MLLLDLFGLNAVASPVSFPHEKYKPVSAVNDSYINFASNPKQLEFAGTQPEKFRIEIMGSWQHSSDQERVVKLASPAFESKSWRG